MLQSKNKRYQIQNRITRGIKAIFHITHDWYRYWHNADTDFNEADNQLTNIYWQVLKTLTNYKTIDDKLLNDHLSSF